MLRGEWISFAIMVVLGPNVTMDKKMNNVCYGIAILDTSVIKWAFNGVIMFSVFPFLTLKYHLFSTTSSFVH